jgi:RNA polymerase sigma-70 factor (ECF subfamily)
LIEQFGVFLEFIDVARGHSVIDLTTERELLISDRDADDAALLADAQAGDLTAFTALCERLEAPARRFVRWLVGMVDDEDDILQDALLALYLNLPRIDPPAKLRPFVYRVLRNRCYDHLRARLRHRVEALDEIEIGDDQPAAPDTPPDETAQWRLVATEVQAAVDQLPELQRQTLILYGVEAMSYAEIAETMNTSIGTVKSRLFYAKKNLRSLLSPETLELLD